MYLLFRASPKGNSERKTWCSAGDSSSYFTADLIAPSSSAQRKSLSHLRNCKLKTNKSQPSLTQQHGITLAVCTLVLNGNQFLMRTIVTPFWKVNNSTTFVNLFLFSILTITTSCSSYTADEWHKSFVSGGVMEVLLLLDLTTCLCLTLSLALQL